MSDLPVTIGVDEVTGVWSVDGQPMILVPRHFWGFIQQECERQFGVNGARAVYEAATCRAAQIWCEREAHTHGLAGVHVLHHYIKRLSQRGFGQIAIESIDPAAGTATICVNHSVYAAEYGTDVGRHVCYPLTFSFLGGMRYVMEAGGRQVELVAEEVQCVSSGSECCRFEVRQAPRE